VLGLLLTSKRAAKQFGEKGGCIINIGSVASTLTPPASSIYAATKSAVDAITRVLAKELGPQNIRVNSINPGVIDTEGARAMETYEQVANEIKALTPLGRTGMPEDIGLIAAFLASDEARWLTEKSFSAAVASAKHKRFRFKMRLRERKDETEFHTELVTNMRPSINCSYSNSCSGANSTITAT